jgi:DNA-binding transcriptional LysR family regulator
MSSFVFARFVRYFDAVSRFGSIRKAAEHLSVSPSAIDRQLLHAEDELRVRLFERLPRGLRLTASGEILIDAIRRWQHDFKRVKFEIEGLRGLRRGEVRLAVAEGPAVEFVPNTLASFIRDHPNISHRVVVAGSEDVRDLVLEGKVDVGLSFNPQEVPALRIERAVKFRLGAVVPPNHPFAGLKSVKLSDCAQHPVIIPDEATSLRHVVDSAVAKTKINLRAVVTASSIALMKAMVAEGCGVGLLTSLDASLEIRSGKLVYVPLSDKAITPSSLSLIVAAERQLAVASILLTRYFAVAMDELT